MAAETTYTFDIDPARRPSPADLGCENATDDAEFAPDKEREGHADQLKQWNAQIAGAGRLLPAAIVEITNSGAPSISYVAAMGTGVDASVFDVTDEATGTTLIEWTRGVLPTAYLRAKVFVDGDGSYLAPYAVRVSDVSAAGLDGVRVKTRADGGALADVDFTVWIF